MKEDSQKAQKQEKISEGGDFAVWQEYLPLQKMFAILRKGNAGAWAYSEGRLRWFETSSWYTNVLFVCAPDSKGQGGFFPFQSYSCTLSGPQ